MTKMTTINDIDELLELEEDCKPLVLNKNNPDKGQDFFLWRGANNADYELMTSLQVHLKRNLGSNNPNEWRANIKDVEKKLLNQFLTEIEPNKDDLEKQYNWFDQMPGKEDTVWILSVMQHYGCPTRFVDFTACFWTAIFFATDCATENNDMILYSLRCKNENHNDTGGNKLPKDSKGNPWRNDNGKVCINDFLGNVIRYGTFDKSSKDMSRWEDPKQAFGWERPARENARIEKQKGFFVYPVDASKTLEEILNQCKEFRKYKINRTLLLDICEILKEKNLNSWVMYLDLQRAFEKFTEEIV